MLSTTKTPSSVFRVDDLETQQSLKTVLERTKQDKQRLTLVYENTLFLTVVPMDDVELIEKLEDCIDNANADKALKEEGFISEKPLDQELGW